MLKPIEKPKPLKKTKKKKIKGISFYKPRADKAFSDFIRARDNFTCITCGAVCEDPTDWRQRKMFHNGHYIPRDCLPLRYAENNCNCQCYGCNVKRKGNMHIYTIRMVEKYGEDILYDHDETLKDSKANPKKYSIEFYKSIIDIYTDKLEDN